MPHYKLNITNFPVYLDGCFLLYLIRHQKGTYPEEILEKVCDAEFYYEELSLTDNIAFENEKRTKKIKLKIRIPQNRSISSLNVLKIGKNFYKVFNIYHFKNKDGILQSDITLEEYNNAKIKEGDSDE